MTSAPATHAHDAPFQSAAWTGHTTSLGLPSLKLAFWTFLGSECFFFGTLIATYLSYRGKSLTGPYPAEIFNFKVTSISSFVLLMSSYLMVLALHAVQHNDRFQARLWLFGTALFGLIFVGFQSFEFTEFFHKGLTLQKNLFGTTFFVMTGFHGAHVAVGVFWLLSLFVLDLFKGIPPEKSLMVEIAGLYWHFVDIVWIVIFTVVYLIPDPSMGA